MGSLACLEIADTKKLGLGDLDMAKYSLMRSLLPWSSYSATAIKILVFLTTGNTVSALMGN